MKRVSVLIAAAARRYQQRRAIRPRGPEDLHRGPRNASHQATVTFRGARFRQLFDWQDVRSTGWGARPEIKFFGRKGGPNDGIRCRTG